MSTPSQAHNPSSDTCPTQGSDLVTKPLSEGEPFHLELDKLKACIHCGMCLPACPTYMATGSEAESPRGRLYLMRQLLRGELDEPNDIKPHLDACLGCMGCQTVCPSGVQYGDLLLESREQLAKADDSLAHGLKRWVMQHVLPDKLLLSTLFGFLWLYQQSGLQALVRKSRILKLIPPLAYQESLLPRLKKTRSLHHGLSFGNPSGERVVLFTGCVMDAMYNHVHWATIDALMANGYYVLICEQTCCGALAHHSGDVDITETLAIENVGSILAHNPDWIVVNSAGCGSTLKHYDAVLKNNTLYHSKAHAFSEKVVDVMELLALAKEQNQLKPFKHSIEKTVTYHAACHLHHAQGVRSASIDVIADIDGLTLVPLEDAETCCGSAGTYNVEHPDISQTILNEKMAHVRNVYQETRASSIVTGNPGCMLQIEKGLRESGLAMQVQHPVELVSEAYGRPTARP